MTGMCSNEWNLHDQVEQFLTEYQKEHHLWMMKGKTSFLTGTVEPQWFILYHGYFIALELKATDKKNVMSQPKFNVMTEMSRAGGLSVVASDSKFVCDVLKACAHQDEQQLIAWGMHQHQTMTYDDYKAMDQYNFIF